MKPQQQAGSESKANSYLDYIHFINKSPTNLQMFGMCSKDTKVALRLGDGTDIAAEGDFSGGWNPGADIGRYTTDA